MGRTLRRPHAWLVAASVATAMEALSLTVARIPSYEFILLGNPCGQRAGLACLAQAHIVLTYPYLWWGVVLFLTGAVVMGFAIWLLRRWTAGASRFAGAR